MASNLSLLARTEIGLGLLDSASEHAQALAEIADGSLENPTFRATANHALAVVALARGEATEAEGLAHAALAEATEHELAPYVFPALDVLAAVAAALDSFEEAARILGAADRAREELGRVRWPSEQAAVQTLQERLRAELGEETLAEAVAQGRAMSTDEAVGWLRRSRGSCKRPAGGWESLTPTELQVVQFAAEGLTNPEIGEQMFIARGTVKIHLSHIYTKLDIRNRSELATLVARRTERNPLDVARECVDLLDDWSADIVVSDWNLIVAAERAGRCTRALPYPFRPALRPCSPACRFSYFFFGQ